VKIALVQTRPVKGDITANIADHKRMISLALENSAELIVFPELSVTGYEPELAKELAIDYSDPVLEDFQTISDNSNCVIAVGMPVRQKDGITISLIFFQPGQSRKLYSKKYLHSDEEPFFVSGRQFPIIAINGQKISPAICYELSIPGHATAANENGGEIYLASVAKTASGMDKAIERLADIAREYSMTVLVSNCVGRCDNFECGGRSSAWNYKGILTGQLDTVEEGILLVDTLSEKTITLHS
jgi:predicted amidohydrolase